MSKKVVTIDIEEKKLTASAKTKSVKAESAKTEKQIEAFGVVEINNNGAVKKLKNTTDKGFEKNVVANAKKKAVKKELEKVDDYFDFSFRKSSQPVENKDKEETTAKTATKTTSKAKTVKTKTEAKKTTNEVVEVVSEKAVENAEIKSEIEKITFDSEACAVIRIAQLGSLFDCEKCMINVR